MAADFDVAIAGAGPAGCAVVIALTRHAPGLRVCLAAPPMPEVTRQGETVPPPIRSILDHLGLWRRFQADGHTAAFRTLSAWGAPVLAGNEFILHTQQVGWRLDRCRFDRMMLAAGATKAVVLPASVTGVALSGQHWTLRIGNDAVHARFLVDASGRAANVSRRVGLRMTGADRLIGCFATVPDSGAAMRDTLIEAVPEGWWFATRLPDGRHVLGCLTDADLLRRLDLRRPAGWLDRLGATRFARLHWSGDPPESAPRLVAAGSRQLRGAVQGPFLAVGDALASFDPISGQGIVNALRSGVFAAYAAADWLRGDAGGVERYRSLAEREYAGYRRILRDYYRDEMRWPNAPFWRRRHLEFVDCKSDRTLVRDIFEGHNRTPTDIFRWDNP